MYYKYRQFDMNGIRILLDKEIYFAKPGTLNDPMDSSHDIIKTVNSIFDSTKDPVHRDIIKSLYGDHYIKSDTGESFSILQVIAKNSPNAGVFSCSEDCANTIMWAHYGGNHTGLCLGFDEGYFDSLLDNREAHDVMGGSAVSYKSNVDFERIVTEFVNETIIKAMINGGAIDLSTHDMQEVQHKLITEFFLVKHLAWEYERERRYVTEIAKTMPFPPEALKEIIVGSKISEMNLKTIKNICTSPEWRHVDLRQATFIPSQLKMETIPCQ